MGMTITEKILAFKSGKKHVEPGEIIMAGVDLCLGNDITAPIAINEFRSKGFKKVFDRTKIALVPDHFTPNKDIKSAEQAKLLRDFAREHEIVNYFEVGRVGIEHALLPEKGLVIPGDLVIGADSHTCTYGALGAFATGVGSTDLAAAFAIGKVWLKVPETIKFVFNGKLGRWTTAKDLILFLIGKIGVSGALYKSMEYAGSTFADMPIAGRLTISNMAIEAGAKNGIFPADDITLEYVKGRTSREPRIFLSDKDARYAEVMEFDATEIEPQVAFPHLPENTRKASESSGVKIDQAVIGSCTNGQIEDLRAAAEILKGNKVHKDVRLLVIPATQLIYKQAMKEGLIDIFIDAEAAVSLPTCGPCLGGHMGILAKGERAIATTNRNFVGRMGDPGSEVYLSSPYVAAASAIKGYIAHPAEVVKEKAKGPKKEKRS
jgi:3-isopropylmalate/(R)-2-methylmalate dehydratase large subunit